MYRSLNLKIISLLVFVAVIFAVLIPTTTKACACGMLVPENNQTIGMTGEKGVVVFDGLKSSEQMAINFQLGGTSSDTALVVPTPVKADVSQIKAQVFTDLEEIAHSNDGILVNSQALKGSSDSVKVLEIKTVGNFQIAELKTNSYKDLYDWTRDNGYYLEAEAESPVRTYIDKGFVLNVIKLKKDANVSNINPLEFTFKTKSIFYPLMEIKDSQDSQRDKSLELFLLTDGKITDPSIVSNYGSFSNENQEMSSTKLNQDITKTSDSDFTNLKFTAGKYFLTYINTDDYSKDTQLMLGLGNPGAKTYKPLGLDYSHSLPIRSSDWLYPIIAAVIIIISTLMAFILTSKRKPNLAKNKSKNANLAHVPKDPEVAPKPESVEKTDIVE